MNEIFKSKTFWTGVVGVVTAISSFMTGALPGGEAVQIGLTSLIGIFLRQGINKAGN
jgi:hypothetical protein